MAFFQVKQALSDEHYKTFSQILNDYKQVCKPSCKRSHSVGKSIFTVGYVTIIFCLKLLFQSRNLDTLIEGLKPLFTRSEAQYPLWLGKLSPVKHVYIMERMLCTYQC